MTISKQIQHYMENGSWIRKLFEEGNALKNDGTGRPVYDFSLGNPTLPPPPQFHDALNNYINTHEQGISRHGYMANAGYESVRQAVADSLNKDHDVTFSKDSILMTVGAAGAVNVALKALLDPGDEVIVSAPYFVEYGFYVANHGGTLVQVESADDFDLDVSAIEKAITEKTKLVLVTNPSNPTGKMYPQKTLNELGNRLRNCSKKIGRTIYLMDDAPYRKLVYDVKRCTSIFNAYENALMATSHSKDLSLPGERIGFLALSPKLDSATSLFAACTFANRILGFVNAPAMMQHILTSLQNVAIDLNWYKRKRDKLFESLTEIGYQVPYPDGAFYMFPKVPYGDDVSFVNRLKEERLLAVPGRGFGKKGYFRIAYCVSDITIEEAINVFKRAFTK